MVERDIIVIGAGIFGAAVARALARRGLGERVRVLERGQPAGGATSRAAALVTLARDDAGLVALARETLHLLAALTDEVDDDAGCHAVGALHVASAAGVDGLRARAARHTAAGVTGGWLDGVALREALARQAPWLDPAAVVAAVHYPDECHVDPYRLASACLRAARRGGVTLQSGADVARIDHAGGRVRGVVLADGTVLPARIVVNAAGAWANRLAEPLGRPLPMAPVRSQYWITAAAPPVCPRDGAIVLLPEIRAYARPETGALLFGLRERQPAVADARTLPADLSGFVFDPTDPEGWNDLADGAPALARFAPVLDRLGIAHHITGPSNYTPDGGLVLGPDPALHGLFVASGCNGSGITFSGGVGRLVAEWIAGEPGFVSPALTARWSPARAGHFDPYDRAFLQSCAAARAQKSSG